MSRLPLTLLPPLPTCPLPPAAHSETPEATLRGSWASVRLMTITQWLGLVQRLQDAPELNAAVCKQIARDLNLAHDQVRTRVKESAGQRGVCAARLACRGPSSHLPWPHPLLPFIPWQVAVHMHKFRKARGMVVPNSAARATRVAGLNTGLLGSRAGAELRGTADAHTHSVSPSAHCSHCCPAPYPFFFECLSSNALFYHPSQLIDFLPPVRNHLL